MKLHSFFAAGVIFLAVPALAQTVALNEAFDSDAGFTKLSGSLTDLSDLDAFDGPPVNEIPITFQSNGGANYFGIYDPETGTLDSNDFDGNTVPASDQLLLIGNDTPFLTFQNLDDVSPVTEKIRAIQWDNIDISTLPSLQYSIDLAEGDASSGNDIDKADFFLLQVRIDSDDMMDWTTVLAFYGNPSTTSSNGDWGLDASPMDGDADAPLGTGVELTNNWATFGNSFPGTGSDIDVRVVVRVDAGDEDLSIDNLVISESTDTPPSGVPSDPTDGASGVKVDQLLSITFDEDVQPGTGSIHIWSDGLFGGLVESLAADGPNVYFDNATVKIDPTSNLATLTDYHIEIDGTAIKDLAGKSFPGFSDSTTWNFMTASADTDAPFILSTVPAHNTTGAPLDPLFTVTFNEAVAAKVPGGNAVIKKPAEPPFGDEVIDTIPLTVPQTTFSGPQIQFGLSAGVILEANTTYYVEISAEALEDVVGFPGSPNQYPGFSGNSTWSFTTGEELAELVINEIMQDPSAVTDPSGEWFEIHNLESTAVNIEGWTIKDAGSDSHLINNGGPLVVPAGGYLVLGRNSDSMTNGGVTVHYQYSNFLLTNDDDQIILEDTNNSEIDRVEWDGGPNFPDPTGASMALTDPALDNNVGSNWYTSTPAFGSGDKGTPGAENVEPTSDFLAWLATNGYSATGFEDDSLDADGDTAGEEWYFFNSNPDIPSNNGSPVSEVTATGAGTFTFTHRRPTTRTGVTETYVYSFDLDGTWNPSDATVTISPGAPVPDGPDYEIVTVAVTVDPPTTAKVFVRLEISETP